MGLLYDRWGVLLPRVLVLSRVLHMFVEKLATNDSPVVRGCEEGKENRCLESDRTRDSLIMDVEATKLSIVELIELANDSLGDGRVVPTLDSRSVGKLHVLYQ